MNDTISQRKQEANRANAGKSTGPRTAAGKAASRMNARKHGMLSKEVLVRALNRYENERELEALHERFREDLQPVGPVEEMLVDQIVTARWRLRRVLVAEAGETAVNLDEGHWKRSREMPISLMWSTWEQHGDAAEEMQYSTRGSGLVEAGLQQLRAAVEKEGELSAAMIKNFKLGFRGRPNMLTMELEWLAEGLKKNLEGLDPAARRERKEARALEWLDEKIAKFLISKTLCESHDGWMEELRTTAAVLPSAETLEKISRYEAGLERQLYRAMTQLERIQRMRQGEAVPPPLTLEVSGNG